MPNFCVLCCKTSDITVHRFPDRFKFPERFKTWVTLAGGKLKSESDYERFQKMRICNLHFTDNYKNRNNRLNVLAIPTLHLPVVTIHKFPHPHKNPEIFRTWVDIASEFLKDMPDEVIFKNRSVCDRHFTEDVKNRNNRLNRLAIPTLHLPNGVHHVFPNPVKFPERFKAWVNIVKGKSERDFDYTKSRICDRHFVDKDRNRNNRLNALAIPSLYLDGNVRYSATVPNIGPSLSAVQHSTPQEPTLPQTTTTSTAEHEEPPSPTDMSPSVSGVEPSTPEDTTLLQPTPQPVPTSTAECEEPHSPAVYTSPSVSDVEPPSPEDTTLLQPTPQPIPTSTAECEEPPSSESLKARDRSRRQYWKLKLSHILHSTQFCGMCLSAEGDMNTLNGDVEIVVDGTTTCQSLIDIVNVVFNKEDENLAGGQICNNCIEKLIQSYKFIQNARKTLKILNFYLDDLYNKTCYIRNNLLKKDDTSNVYNVIIALDKNDIIENYDSGKQKGEDESPNRNIDLPSSKRTRPLQNTFKCNICSASYRSLPFLLKHFNLHSKSRCKICHQMVQDGGLLEHLKEHHEHSIHLCSICNIALYSAEALAAHEQEWHYIEDSKCLTCLKSYPPHELELHQCRFSCTSCTEAPCVHHKYLMSYREQILNDALSAKCLDCNYVCKGKTVLITHVDGQHLKHQPYTCDSCSRTFSSQLALYTHVSKSHRHSYKCQHCRVELPTVSIYESHIKSCESFSREGEPEHRNVTHSKRVFPCDLCNRIFCNNSMRRRHCIQAHGRQRKERVASLDCVVCLEKFATRAGYLLHMKSHGPDVKYPCRICNTQYGTLLQYKAHSRIHVSPPAVCEVCGKEMRQFLLKQHMATHADAVVTCETCGKFFKNIYTLKKHQKIHLESVPCSKCGKLINPARLRCHYKNHLIQEDPGLRAATKQRANLKCDLCEYTTWNKIMLECHMNRNHFKVRPYVCHICSKAFSGKHLLQNHTNTHREKNITCTICMKKYANAASLKMHLRLHTGEKPFTCALCGDTFRSSSILRAHTLNKHSDKNIACPLCSNKFHSVKDLRRHIKKIHYNKEKDKKFAPRELQGLGAEHYHLFHDGRRVKVDEEIDFHLL